MSEGSCECLCELGFNGRLCDGTAPHVLTRLLLRGVKMLALVSKRKAVASLVVSAFTTSTTSLTLADLEWDLIQDISKDTPEAEDAVSATFRLLVPDSRAAMRLAQSVSVEIKDRGKLQQRLQSVLGLAARV